MPQRTSDPKKCAPHALAGPLLAPASRDLPALTVPLALNCTPRALTDPTLIQPLPAMPSRTSDLDLRFSRPYLAGALRTTACRIEPHLRPKLALLVPLPYRGEPHHAPPGPAKPPTK